MDINTLPQPKHIADLNKQNQQLQRQVREQQKQLAEIKRRNKKAKSNSNDNSVSGDEKESDVYLKLLEQQNMQLQNLMRCEISKRRK